VPRLARDRVTWLIYAQLGVWGYVLYGFGPIVPLLRDEQGTSASVASLHGTGLAAGAAIGSALFPLATRRFGRGGTLWLALAGVAVTVTGLCLAHPLAATLIAATAISTFGTMVVGGVVTSLTAYCGPASSAAIAEANAAACGMGVLAPLVVGLAVGAGYGWRPGMAVAVGLIGLLALFSRVRVPAGDPVSTVDRPGRLPRPYWVAWTLMTFTGSVEVCLSLWAGDVLRGRAGMTAGAAAAAISGIVGGMALGRLVGGWLSLRVDPVRLFLAVLTVSFIGFALFWTATASWFAVSGLVILGLGNAMHYPLGISMALRLAPGQEDQAAARATYGMVIGFGLAPFALGAIADALGVHTAFLLVPLFLAVAAVLVVRLAVPAPLPDYAR
jgi:MFS family permease